MTRRVRQAASAINDSVVNWFCNVLQMSYVLRQVYVAVLCLLFYSFPEQAVHVQVT